MTYKSESLKVLEKNGIGYRNPNVGTIGFQEALLTLEFEYEELANEDILDTLYDQGYISEPSYEEAVAFINNQQVKVNETMYSVWLCATREDVRDNYPDDYETEEVYEIESYTLPPEYIVLSDLGSQGILIMFPNSGFSHIQKDYIEGFEPTYEEDEDFDEYIVSESTNNTLIYRGSWHKTLSNKFESAPAGLFFGSMPSKVMGWGDVKEYRILNNANIYNYENSSEVYCHENNLVDKEYKEFKEYFYMYGNIKKISDFFNLSRNEKDELDKRVVEHAGKQFCWYDLWTWYTQLAAKIDLEEKGYDGARWINEDAGNSEQYQIWNLDIIEETDSYDFDFDDDYEYDYHYHLNDEGEYEEDEELYESIRDNKAVSGHEVSEYIKWITEDPDMVPDNWLTKYVEPNEWVLKQIPIKSLYVDKSFKEALDYELELMDDPNYYYRYKPEEVEDRDSLYNPIVFYNKPGEEIVVDGYSRTIEHIFNGEEYIDAYILADYEDLVDNN